MVNELDLLPTEEVIELLLQAETRVVPAVRAAIPGLTAGAARIADRLNAGGRLIFVGAGTSGRIAVAEAAELPGTFGLERSRVLARVAGGAASTDDDEDDLELVSRDLAELALSGRDTVIAVAASGATPYTLEVAQAGVAAEAEVIAVVTVAGSPLARLAEVNGGVAIEAVVGEEVLRGSTRLTAGTAQKVALNALTTAAMVRFGRVHGDLMIDVVAANAKLKLRSAAIVAEIAGSSLEEAQQALSDCSGSARAAVLVLVTGLAPEQAVARSQAHPSLRELLAP
ncbi:N-acetylmuramic acid 6-phosphate etherase [Jatrophihabitans sp. GAS493]|uniref:N-acetylmuramic acid 6-phosphate etherase n=1 Tax=Jatrophihabitans sp. GAS493 TaxID=1907575 RepID=UPI000BBFA114|nr:N-acetylmuramic acid 6-phosphate etherase [Jatrophihabitans sp. GAS493]SOD71704.1 N-acetylmuramic acid 6-phosphate etherase [Jatrophihabitans sp. GAS493]